MSNCTTNNPLLTITNYTEHKTKSHKLKSINKNELKLDQAAKCLELLRLVVNSPLNLGQASIF
jgi:hypothetical protein